MDGDENPYYSDELPTLRFPWALKVSDSTELLFEASQERSDSGKDSSRATVLVEIEVMLAH